MAQSIVNEAVNKTVNEAATESAQEFAGFAANPAPLLVAQYERIAQQEMQVLPFYHASMPIVAECVLFEGQWLGCVLTPW
ncbi:[NiFe]-hydrogenase assembly chaperone HybE, partial [Aeromonas sp. CPF2-S1]|nr:[NiFe]-hydrogenase assembly chaperone HybE [Aeromonas sp. CPF2-S1]